MGLFLNAPVQHSLSQVLEQSHSGGDFEMVQVEGEQARLRKKLIVADEAHRARINDAIAKYENSANFLRQLKSLNKPGVPKLFSIQSGKSSVTIEMEYVPGVSGKNLLVEGSRAAAVGINNGLEEFLRDCMSRSETTDVEVGVVLEKMSQVSQNCADQKIQDYIAAFVQIFSNHRKPLSIPIGPCHGDLTFSNMIWSDSGKLFLVDFLDSFLESPLQDVAKLNQEYLFGWSGRSLEDHDVTRARIFLPYTMPPAWRELSERFQFETLVLTGVCLFRIAPYLKDSDQVTRHWLISSIEKYLDRFSVCEF